MAALIASNFELYILSAPNSSKTCNLSNDLINGSKCATILNVPPRALTSRIVLIRRSAPARSILPTAFSAKTQCFCFSNIFLLIFFLHVLLNQKKVAHLISLLIPVGTNHALVHRYREIFFVHFLAGLVL